MNVNDAQIKTLYEFTRKHFVEFYDVQTELVDHLANGIENQWNENPNIIFDEALTREFKKFGVYGFSEILVEKQKALEKIYRKEIWKHLKEYFKVPKIIITAFSIWALFQLLQFFEQKQIVIVILITSIWLAYFFYLFKESKRIKKTQKETGKKWLYESMTSQFGGYIQFLNIPIQMSIINFDREWDFLAQICFVSCIVIFTLVFYILAKVVSPKLKNKFEKENPEYKTAKLVTNL